jgi:hypothetical protein
VPSSKIPASRPVPSIARAAQRTQSVIEDLQSRLTQVSQPGAHPEAAAPTADQPNSPRAESSESEDDLERQLLDYFSGHPFSEHPGESSPDSPARREGLMENLRKRVVDQVADRILAEWDQHGSGGASRLRDEVLERLVERVLRRFQSES